MGTNYELCYLTILKSNILRKNLKIEVQNNDSNSFHTKNKENREHKTQELKYLLAMAKLSECAGDTEQL